MRVLWLILCVWLAGCQPPGVSAKASGEASSEASQGQSGGTIIINCLQVVGQSSRPGQSVYCIERSMPGTDKDFLRELK